MARKKNPQCPELWLAAVRAESRHGNSKEADSLMAKALQECPNSGILWATSIEMVPSPKRKSRTADAYKMYNQDPSYILAALGKLLWHDRKIVKAGNYLNRVVTLKPDIGDFWALYYMFEFQHGDEETRKDVVERCVAAELRHGEKWQAIAKAVDNSHQSTEAILKKVVLVIGMDEISREHDNE